MLAAVMRAVNRPLSIEEVSTPHPGPGEVQVRIEASGLCRSDNHYLSGASPVARTPIVLGHEVAGIVHEIGSEVTAVAEGDRVTVHYLITCGACAVCRSGNENLCADAEMIGKTIDGGFAEFIVIPQENAIPVPDGVVLEYAALAADAVATPYHAMKLARVVEGDTALIVGVGGLGIHAVQLPKLFGAQTVIAVDLSAAKRTMAMELGADFTIDPAEEDLHARIREITAGRGVDVAIELIGLKQTIEASIQSLARAGRMVIVGICPVSIEVDPYNDILLKEAVVTGNCDHTAEDIRELLPLIERGQVDLSRSVSQRIRLSQINDGLTALRDRESDPIRIVITEMA